jgi:N6-adenosine-specific RNA methylase IME4/ParB-like chromosome segregation protein Spo0J
MAVVDLQIDPEFKALIPPLAEEERQQLEANIRADGCRDPLVVWKGLILDGHNRYEICSENGWRYRTVDQMLATRDDAKIWIIRNQFGRRNLQPFQRGELALVLKPLITAKALARKLETLKRGDVRPDTQISAEREKGETRQEVAKAAGLSHDTIAKVEVISAKASEEVKGQLRRGEISINKAHGDIVREEKRAEIVERLESVEVVEAKAAAGVYDVAVIDPPWPMEKIERDVTPTQVAFEYPTMDEGQLSDMALPLADDAHVWLWTTHRFLPMAFRLLDNWGLKYVCAFVWHKPGGFQPFGLPQYNCEFALYARKGTPQFVDTKQFPVCFDAARGAHSEKPEAFYEMVRRVTAGRRIDMFNRRLIDGFDGWGKEAA